MGGEWPTVQLGDVVQNFDSRRIPISKREREKRPGPYPYYGATGIMDYVDDYLFDGLYLLIAEDGSVERPDGKPFLQLVNGQFWVNNHAHVLRGDNDEDTKFVYYSLSTVAIRPYMSGSVQSKLSQRNLNRILIHYPRDPRDRRAIARILGTLDDKIELNRRMNETLEAMAQALFKSWFVDFDPVLVNAIKAGNPIPEKFAARAAHYRANPDALGLPEDILGLFPARFVDSELGPIPEGWDVKPIGEMVKCVGGATPSTKNPEFWEGGTNPFLTPRDMASLDAPFVLDTERHITDAGVDRISSKKVPVGTVLLSSRAPIGYLAINKVPVSINQGIIAMVCDGEIPNYYVFFWVKNNMDVIKGKAGGTTFAEISKKNFRPIPALRPSDAILEKFADVSGPIVTRIAEHARSSITLAKVRDTLLSKLISGELRVPDVAKILEDVE